MHVIAVNDAANDAQVFDFDVMSSQTPTGDDNYAEDSVPVAPVGVRRRKLHLKDGGETYLFATTTVDGIHMLVRTSKILPVTQMC